MEKKSFFKKAQAMVLTLAMLVSVMGTCASITAFAEPGRETESKTEGEIVANNYELYSAEKDLIASGLLVGETVTYNVPNAEDGLISVDTDNKTISVKNFEDEKANVWEPISVNIVVGSDVKETVSIVDGMGTYTFDENAFSVVAEYALDVKVDKGTQTTLLNAPKYLYDGLANVKEMMSVKDTLSFIEAKQAMDALYQLGTSGYLINVMGQWRQMTLDTQEARDAAVALHEQWVNNSNGENGMLDLTFMLNEFNKAESKVKYLLENGAALKAKAAETQVYLKAIIDENFWNLAEFLGEPILLALLSDLKDAEAQLKAISGKTWDILETKVIKDGLSDLGYVALDTYLNNITTLTDVSALEIKNPLRVATTKIQYNMSMFDVKVDVVLNLTDSSSADVKYYQYDKKSTTITLSEGATESEILAAVLESGIEQSAKDVWAGKYVDGKFTVTKSALPGELTEDIVYTITYNPAIYNIVLDYENSGDVVEYPYGYVITLESHADAAKAYDYTIGGVYYAQGATYTVEGDATITRKVGKSYISSNLYQIIADNYLSGIAKDILTSGALKNNVPVAVRYPDNSTNIVTLKGNKLSAANYSASYNGLYWKPYSYTLSTGKTFLFEGKNDVEITEDFGTVTVTYHLYLKNFDSNDVLDITNMAYALKEESNGQIDALNTISAQKGNLETLNRTMINILASIIETTVLNDDAAKSKKLQDCFTAVLEEIRDKHTGDTNLFLFDIVNEYLSSSDKLLYYYNNNEKIRSEIGKMAVLMTKMLGEEEESGLSKDDKLAALEKLMRSLPSNIVSPDMVDEYVGKLTSLETTMNTVNSNLSAPNALIDLTSKNIGKLTAALASEENIDKLGSLPHALYLEDSTIVVVASNKVAVTVTLNVEGGKNTTVSSDTVSADTVIGQSFVDALIAKIKAELAAQGINESYYNTTFADNAFDALLGVEAGDITVRAYEFTWTYKDFAVSVPGTEIQYVNYNDRVIDIPASTNVEYRYDYFINGTKVNSGAYTLSQAEFDSVVAGTLVVTMKEVYVLREKLTAYVNGLNASIGNDQAAFALVEDANGNFSIVLKIDASAPGGLTAAIQGVAVGMVQGSYPYVGMNNDTFLADGSVHLQTVVDTLLNSGFGVDTMLEIIDANGNINNYNGIKGNVLTDKNIGKMGGKLLETTMQLGSNASDATSLPFYITLGGVSSEFVQIRNLMAGKFGSFMGFSLENGAVTLTLDMPQKMYEAFLAVLLVTGNVNISDINAVNGEITATFVNNLLMPLFQGDVSVETFDNTLKKFGADLDLSSQKGAKALFNTFKKFYTESEYTYDELSATASGNLGISSLIDSMNVGVLGNIIAEKDTGIDIAVSVKLKDLGDEFEALYIDTGAAGVTNKFGLVKDVEELVNNIAGPATVILLKDVKADLTFNTITLFNLNGFSVDGNLTANRKTIVINSNIESAKIPTVTGKLSGNLSLAAGKYLQDASAFVKNGFTINENGVVSNEFYDIYKDENGDINVDINLGLIRTREVPDIASLMLDLVCDLLFNGYSTNYLELDGNKIFDISIDDFVGIYSGSNRIEKVLTEILDFISIEDLNEFMNKIIDDVLDFENISKALENGTPIFDYGIVTKPWNVEFIHVTDGDYISSSLTSGKSTIDGRLKVRVVGGDEDRAYFVDLFKELGETIKTDIDFEIWPSKSGNNIRVDVDAKADVFVDWTNPKYAVMFSIIAANGNGGATRDKLVAAIKNYYETGDTDALSAAFNSLTVAQLLNGAKSIGYNTKFTDIVKSLGLSSVVESDVVKLEGLFDKMGKVVAFALRKLDIDGTSRKLSTFVNSDGTYGIERKDIEKFLEVSIFRGYGFETEVSVSSASFKLQLFGEVVFEEEVDYSELLRLIEEAKKLNKDDYTAESWAKLEAALSAAEAALSSDDQLVVNEAAKTLREAIEGLVEKPVVNYDILKSLIEEAKRLNKDDYTAESWAVLEEALANAIAALSATTQEEVDAAAKALKDAIAHLVEKPVVPEVNYDELNALIAQAQGLNKDKYTADSWAVLEEALANAIAALSATTQEEVDAAAKALKDAIAQLDEKPVLPEVNYDELNALIAQAQGLNKDKYTAESWAVLEEALANAIAALNATTQEEVDAAAKALKDAIDGLVEKPVVPGVNYDELNALIAQAQGLNKDKYTADSWTALEEALANAIAALNATTQEEVDAAAKALKDAIDGLVEKPVVPGVNYDELNALIAQAQGLNKDNYTEDSWINLEAALANAIAALNATTQAEVDAAARALRAAIADLALKAPEFVDGHGAPTVGESDKIAGSVVDYENKVIYLDTIADGITVDELEALLNFYANNAETIEVIIGDGTLTGETLVANGSTVTAIAKKNGTMDAKVTFNIVVLGDINCNGRVEIGDAVLITKMLVGDLEFNDIESAAADNNSNGRTDIGDATRIASKIVDWNNYETMLGTAIM